MWLVSGIAFGTDGLAKNDAGVVFVTLNGQLIRTDVDQISKMGRNTQGVRVVRLRDTDSLVSMARVPTDD